MKIYVKLVIASSQRSFFYAEKFSLINFHIYVQVKAGGVKDEG